MKGYVDLHCHYVPGVDDGVKTLEDGVALLQALHQAGFDKVIATPHIRTAMFENRRDRLVEAFDGFCSDVSAVHGLPELGLGAEHFFDDMVWELFQTGRACPYPGGKAALVEFPERVFPMNIDERFFKMRLWGIRPVLAHPERYSPTWNDSDQMDHLVDQGVVPLMDVMALVGKYGSKPQAAAERMLDEGIYYAVCSDTHRPSDVETTARAIERLHALVGAEEAHELLSTNPTRILAGKELEGEDLSVPVEAR